MATEKLSEEANKNELWESNGHVTDDVMPRVHLGPNISKTAGGILFSNSR